MKKVLTVLLVVIFTLCGCSKNDGKFYLDKEYYGSSEFIEVDSRQINELQEKKASYIVFTYNPFCSLQVPCDDIFKEYMKNNKVSFYSISYDEFSKTELVKTVKFAPSVIIINKGEIKAYLDASLDSDLDKYQDTEKFSDWVNSFIKLK